MTACMYITNPRHSHLCLYQHHNTSFLWCQNYHDNTIENWSVSENQCNQVISRLISEDTVDAVRNAARCSLLAVAILAAD